jgi:DNA-binding HxlR family transcriptional regulator
VQPPIGALDGRGRAGGRVLQLLSDALSVSILRQLTRGPLATPELPGRLGPSSRTTRFARLRKLEDLGLISREKRPGSPPVTYCVLRPSGIELLRVAVRFAGWLGRRADPVSGRSKAAEALALKALGLGWETGVLGWLAERPHSVTELAVRGAPAVSYHDVRRARRELAVAGLVEPVPSEDRGQPYTLSRWTREAAGPLAAAVRWERDSLIGGAGTLQPADGRALLLLAAGLINELPGDLTGRCLLLVEAGSGVSVAVEGGRIVAWAETPPGEDGCHVKGSTMAWLDALLDDRAGQLEMRGAIRLTTALTHALHEACA